MPLPRPRDQVDDEGAARVRAPARARLPRDQAPGRSRSCRGDERLLRAARGDRLRRAVAGRAAGRGGARRAPGRSRGAVREAILRLAHDGLVVRERNRGARVRRFTLAGGDRDPRGARGAGVARRGLRGAAAHRRRGARARGARRTRCGACTPRTSCWPCRSATRCMHRRILEISGHRGRADICARLHSQMVRFQFRTVLAPGRSERSLAEHQRIVEAIAAGDRAARGGRDARAPDERRRRARRASRSRSELVRGSHLQQRLDDVREMQRASPPPRPRGRRRRSRRRSRACSSSDFGGRPGASTVRNWKRTTCEFSRAQISSATLWWEISRIRRCSRALRSDIASSSPAACSRSISAVIARSSSTSASVRRSAARPAASDSSAARASRISTASSRVHAPHARSAVALADHEAFVLESQQRGADRPAALRAARRAPLPPTARPARAHPRRCSCAALCKRRWSPAPSLFA